MSKAFPLALALLLLTVTAKAQTACTDPSYEPMTDVSATFCEGISWPAMGAALEDERPWYEQLWDWLNGSEADAVANGRTPANNYFTSPAPMGCTGTRLTSDALLTAAHCIVIPPDGGVPPWDSGYDGVPSQRRPLVLNDDDRTFPAYRFAIAGPYNNDTTPYNTGADMMVLYRHPTYSSSLSAPYFTGPIYNYLTDGADCTGLLAQGYGGPVGVGPIKECDYGVTGIRTSVYNERIGGCYEPTLAAMTGGDSGGPLYAFVDADGPGGADPVIHLAGVQSGASKPCNRFESTFDHAAWIADRYTGPPMLYAMDYGIELDDFYLDVDLRNSAANTINIQNQSYDVPCVMDFTATLNPIVAAGCTLENFVTNQTASCVDESPTGNRWECNVTVPQYSGESWGLQRVFAQDDTGATATVGWKELARHGAANIRILDFLFSGTNPSGAPPTILSAANTQSVSPGGEVTCHVNATVSQPGRLKGAGCIWESVSYADDIICVSPEPVPAGMVWAECTAPVPDDVPAGSVWTYDLAYARNTQNRSSTAKAGDAGFTAINCGTLAADQTVTSGWTATQDLGDEHGGNLGLEFYARPSSASANSIVMFSDQTGLSNISQARLAVRFNTSGTIDVLDNGAWVDSGVTYSANVWQHFRFDVDWATSILGSPATTYNAYAGPCGSPRDTLRLVSDGSGGRNLAGIRYWAAQSDATVDVADVELFQQRCDATRCLYGDAFCDAAPNGCGGLITYPDPIAGCTVCSGATPVCGADHFTCEAACTPLDCAGLGYECGTPNDNCGDPLNCGSCGVGETCSDSPDYLCVPDAPTELWTSTEQSAGYQFGFNFAGCNYDISPEPEATGSCVDGDADGVDMNRVLTDPDKYAIRLFGDYTCTTCVDPDERGARASGAVLGTSNASIQTLFTNKAPIWISWEMYIPVPIDGSGWLSIFDLHSVAPGGATRLDTNPGLLFVANNGSTNGYIDSDHGTYGGKVRFDWPRITPTRQSSVSSQPLPIGEWFEIEVMYQRSDNATANGNAQLYINNTLVINEAGVETWETGYTNFEAYPAKLYGSPTWTDFSDPSPRYYVRNAKIADGKLSDGDPGDITPPVTEGAGGAGGAGGTPGTGGAGGAGGTPPPTSTVYPLHVASNGRTLENVSNQPFRIHGDTGWGMMHQLCKEADQATCPDTNAREASIDDYLDDLVAKGFNSVIFTAPEGFFSDHSPTYLDAYGNSPFTSGISFSAGGIDTADPYWDHVEYVIGAANDRDILVLLAPFYGGINTSEGWQAYWNPASTSQTDLANYASWYCGRFGVYPNVAYLWGNDIGTGTYSTYTSQINAMSAACAAADSDALHTFHGGRSVAYSSYTGPGAGDDLEERAWLDLRAVYSAENDSYSRSNAEYLDTPTLPTFYFEGRYENAGAYTGEQLRSQHWLAALSGSRAGNIYGNEFIWTAECSTATCDGFRGGPDAWVSHLDDPVRLDMAHLNSVLDSVSWELLVPTARTSTNAYATASDGSAIVAYTANGVSFNIDTTPLAGASYNCVWYDPTNGATDTCTGGTQAVSTPFAHTANNAGGGDGWALVITQGGMDLDFFASDTTCMAPCAVRFDAQQTEALVWSTGTYPVRDSEFVWDFDATNGTSDQDAVGFLAAHVFETSGSYTVTLHVNGDMWNQKTITVQDPTWVGCVSDTTTYTGCPAGANHYDNNNLSAAISASSGQARRWILLERGASSSPSYGTIPTGGTPESLLGAYGAGSFAPAVSSPSNTSIATLWRYQDIIYTCTSNPLGSCINMDGGLILRSNFSGNSQAQFVYADNALGGFIVESSVTSNRYAGFTAPSCANVTIKDSVLTRTEAGQHTWRSEDCDRMLFQNTSFITGSTGQTALRVVNTDWSLIQGNYFDRVATFSYTIGEANLAQHTVWESNYTVTDYINMMDVHGGTQNVAIRNNILVGFGGAARGISVENGTSSAANVWVYNNTVYQPGNSDDFYGVQCAGSGCVARNNLVVANPGGAGCFTGSGTFSNNWCYTTRTPSWCRDPQTGGSTCYNPTMTSTSCGTVTNGKCSNTNFMRPGAGTRGVDQGFDTSVGFDYFDALRDDGLIDVGAVER